MQLRRIREEDLPQLFNMRNDPSIYRWCRQYAPLHWENHKRWYHSQAQDPSIEMFVIEDDHLGVLGVGGLTSIDHINNRAEFSLYLNPVYQGRGLGEQALLQLLNIGFNSIGLNRIWGETFEGNPALAMFKKLGFEEEGIRKEFYFRDGNYIGAHLVSMSAANYNHLHASKSPRS